MTPSATATNRDSLLAKILRIDIDNGDPYAIPPTNPWADGGGVPEAFVWGLRNPWRAAFDGEDLYIADVGQGAWEEVSIVTIADAGGQSRLEYHGGRPLLPAPGVRRDRFGPTDP